MQENKLFKLSEYLNIINILIEKFSFSSLFKIYMTSLMLFYQVKSDTELRKSSHNLFKGFFSCFHLVVISNYSDFCYISEALRINEKNGWITVDGDNVVKNTKLDFVSNEILKYVKKENIFDILNEIKNMSRSSFIQEVIANV